MSVLMAFNVQILVNNFPVIFERLYNAKPLSVIVKLISVTYGQ